MNPTELFQIIYTSDREALMRFALELKNKTTCVHDMSLDGCCWECAFLIGIPEYWRYCL